MSWLLRQIGVVADWLLRTEVPNLAPVHHNARRVPEAEVIRGRCWCGDQVQADSPRGWVDAILLHYRERHPEDEAGKRLADDPDRYSRDERFQPKQW